MERLRNKRGGLRGVITRTAGECEQPRNARWAGIKTDLISDVVDSLTMITEDLAALDDEHADAHREYLDAAKKEAATLLQRLESFKESDEKQKRKEFSTQVNDATSTDAPNNGQPPDLRREAPEFVPRAPFPDQHQPSVHELASALRYVTLPQTVLPSFSGDPLTYWPFINAFDACVDYEGLNERVKLTQLLQCCKGRTKSAIECCSLAKNGYQLARDILHRRFGASYTIVDAWIHSFSISPVSVNFAH